MFFDETYMWPHMHNPRRCHGPRVIEAPFDHCGITPVMSGTMTYPKLYPQTYHKLLPYIKRACDDMELYESVSERMIDEKCDHIHDTVLKMHPDLFEHLHRNDMDAKHKEKTELPLKPFGRMQDGFDVWDGGKIFGHEMDGVREKCLLHDLIKILLLKEFSMRRSRMWR